MLGNFVLNIFQIFKLNFVKPWHIVNNEIFFISLLFTYFHSTVVVVVVVVEKIVPQHILNIKYS